MKKKTKQAGRPAKIIKKEIRAAVRFSKIEHFLIRQKDIIAGMKVTAYVRQITINGAVTTRLSEEKRHFVRQLIIIKICNNIYHRYKEQSYQKEYLKQCFTFKHVEIILKCCYL